MSILKKTFCFGLYYLICSLFIPFPRGHADLEQDFLKYNEIGPRRSEELLFTQGRIVGLPLGGIIKNVRILESSGQTIKWESVADPKETGLAKYDEINEADFSDAEVIQLKEKLVSGEEIQRARQNYEVFKAAKVASTQRKDLFNEIRNIKGELAGIKRQLDQKLLARKIDPKEGRRAKESLDQLISNVAFMKTMKGEYAFSEGNYSSIKINNSEIINVRITRIHQNGNVDAVRGFIEGGSNKRFKGIAYGSFSYPIMEKDKKGYLQINGISMPADEERLPLRMDKYLSLKGREMEKFETILKNYKEKEREALGDLKEDVERKVKTIKENEAKILSLKGEILAADQLLQAEKGPGFVFKSSENAERELQNSKIGKSDCDQISFDNRPLMGRDTITKRSRFWWIHASSSLLEEQLCLAQKQAKKTCYKGYKARNEFAFQVSRSEVASLSFQDGAGQKQEDFPRDSHAKVLSYYVGRGDYRVCLQKTGVNSFDDNEERFIESLRNVYGQYVQKNQFSWNQIKRRKFPGQLKSLTAESIKRILNESSDVSAFIEKVLLYFCDDTTRETFKREGSHISVQESRFWSRNFDPILGVGDRTKVDKRFYLEAIGEARNSGHSLGLNLCHRRLFTILGHRQPGQEDLNRNDDCGDLAVVLNSVRWQNEKCEGFVKNSNGFGATLKSGFYPLDEILPFVYGSTYYIKNE